MLTWLTHSTVFCFLIKMLLFLLSCVEAMGLWMPSKDNLQFAGICFALYIVWILGIELGVVRSSIRNLYSPSHLTKWYGHFLAGMNICSQLTLNKGQWLSWLAEPHSLPLSLPEEESLLLQTAAWTMTCGVQAHQAPESLWMVCLS